MPSAAQRVQVEGIASIALFMLLAAAVAPEPTPRGVGLRGVPRHRAARAEILRPMTVRPVQAVPCRPVTRGAAPDPAPPACNEAAGAAPVPTP